MDKREDLVKRLALFKRKISRQLPVDKMIFFGSMASGRATRDSDIDLIIVSKNFRKKNVLKRSFSLYKGWDINCPVDFLCYTPEEFKEKSKQVSIVREAITHGIEIK